MNKAKKVKLKGPHNLLDLYDSWETFKRPNFNKSKKPN